MSNPIDMSEFTPLSRGQRQDFNRLPEHGLRLHVKGKASARIHLPQRWLRDTFREQQVYAQMLTDTDKRIALIVSTDPTLKGNAVSINGQVSCLPLVRALNLPFDTAAYTLTCIQHSEEHHTYVYELEGESHR